MTSPAGLPPALRQRLQERLREMRRQPAASSPPVKPRRACEPCGTSTTEARCPGCGCSTKEDTT